MKYLMILAALLLLTVSAQADPIVPNISVPPPEGWDEFGICDLDIESAEFYHYAYWDGTTPQANEVDANYEPVVDVIEIAGNTVTVTLDNEYYVHNHKVIRFTIYGSGATGAPDNVGVMVSNEGGDPSPLTAYTVLRAAQDAGTWIMEIVIVVGPQPDEVVITFDVPGAPILLGEAWLSECCQRPTIPSMTTYGLAILILLIAATGIYVIRRRRVTA